MKKNIKTKEPKYKVKCYAYPTHSRWHSIPRYYDTYSLEEAISQFVLGIYGNAYTYGFGIIPGLKEEGKYFIRLNNYSGIDSNTCLVECCLTM